MTPFFVGDRSILGSYDEDISRLRIAELQKCPLAVNQTGTDSADCLTRRSLAPLKTLGLLRKSKSSGIRVIFDVPRLVPDHCSCHLKKLEECQSFPTFNRKGKQ